LVHVFKYAAGQATFERSVSPAPEETEVFLAGLAVQPATGRLYACNEGNHEVWGLHPETLALEKRVGVGQHPHSCVFGADRRHLYVSNWGSRSVSVVDTETSKRVRDIAVGLRPNDMVLAPDGRLFVACAGDNTVHVIQTRTLETPEAAASPAPHRQPQQAAQAAGLRLHRPHLCRIGLVHPAPRCRPDGGLHRASAAEFAVHTRPVPARAGAERFGDPGQGW
jgi:YVTN family beta-propeller protein